MKLYKNQIIALVLICFSSQVLFANDRLVLDFDEFIEIVKLQHPIAHQSNLILKKAEAKRLKAKGGFDPKLQSAFKEKQFKGKDYYSNFGAELKIPTWYGLSFKTGFQQNTGDFINPELSTPTAGLVYAGVNFSVGNGLFIDQRRAEIKEARIYIERSKIEQKLILNQLYFNASQAYWNWFSSFHQVAVMKNALVNSQKRFNVIKKNALLGESSIIDTVEAKAQVYSRAIKLQEYQLKLVKSSNSLNLFLWAEGHVPLELENNVKPEPLDYDRIQALPINIDSLLVNHPKIELLENYIKTQNLAIRLSKEQLKPKLDLIYNPLFENSNSGLSNFEKANYQIGFEFSYPIFTRKARGQYRMEKIEQEQQIIDLTMEKQKIKQSSLNALQTWENYSTQQLMYAQLKSNYEQLAKGEVQLFSAGESSFFLVNSREKAFINSTEGLINSIQLKNEALAYYRYSLCVID